MTPPGRDSNIAAVSRHNQTHHSLAAPYGQYVPAVEVTRGSVVESVHSAAIAVADHRGTVVARLGGVDHVVFLRSSAKPIQAMAVVESGAMEKFGLTLRELAVMAGSHSSEPEHLEAVTGILAKIGLDPSHLHCGTHTPFSKAVAERYVRQGRALTAVEHNCSGKHAGMLAAALAGGHETSNYLSQRHPVQQRILGILAEMTGRIRDRIIVAVDGCGAPTLGVTLSEAARAFARLMSPDGLAEGHGEAASRVVSAMREHPGMVAGVEMLDTELTGWPSPKIISKRGAEGVQCAAFAGGQGPPVACGIAAKVADGNDGRARAALLMETLRQLDVLAGKELARLTASAALVIRSNSGRDVGLVRPAFTLQRA